MLFKVKNCVINLNTSVDLDKSLHYGSVCEYNYVQIDSCWISGTIDAKFVDTDNAISIGGIIS